MFKEGLLKGKRILVTGGGTGLGKEMSRYFLKYGAEVLICGRRESVLEEEIQLKLVLLYDLLKTLN